MGCTYCVLRPRKSGERYHLYYFSIRLHSEWLCLLMTCLPAAP